MTKILKMTRSRGRAGSDTDFLPAIHAGDPLEPTQPLSPRTGHLPDPFPIVRPWYPAALILQARSHDFPRAT